eukprot:6460713-Amphidinium_carterae.1
MLCVVLTTFGNKYGLKGIVEQKLRYLWLSALFGRVLRRFGTGSRLQRPVLTHGQEYCVAS